MNNNENQNDGGTVPDAASSGGQPTAPSKTSSNRFHPRKKVGKQKQHQRQGLTAPKFERRCDELKGFVYDCSDSKQADM